MKRAGRSKPGSDGVPASNNGRPDTIPPCFTNRCATPRAPLGSAMTVASRPLGNGEVNLVRLRQALDDGYNDSELRDLCFELDIDYEDLPGDGQSAKARELVLFARRRGQIAQLVEHVMRDRPQLLVTNNE